MKKLCLIILFLALVTPSFGQYNYTYDEPFVDEYYINYKSNKRGETDIFGPSNEYPFGTIVYLDQLSTRRKFVEFGRISFPLPIQNLMGYKKSTTWQKYEYKFSVTIEDNSSKEAFDALQDKLEMYVTLYNIVWGAKHFSSVPLENMLYIVYETRKGHCIFRKGTSYYNRYKDDRGSTNFPLTTEAVLFLEKGSKAEKKMEEVKKIITDYNTEIYNNLKKNNSTVEDFFSSPEFTKERNEQNNFIHSVTPVFVGKYLVTVDGVQLYDIIDIIDRKDFNEMDTTGVYIK